MRKNYMDDDFGDIISKIIHTTQFIVISVILILAIVLSPLIYFKFIAKPEEDAKREVFKHSTEYTEQAASFLAKEYKEYKSTDNNDEKRAIFEYVIMRYPNLDVDAIENYVIRHFYEKAMDYMDY